MSLRSLAASAGLGAILCGLAAPAAFAQQTTASLRGVTVDDAGAPVKGATIVVVHTPSGTKSTVVSDDAGTFDARGLRVGGPYKVVGKAKGFDDQTVDDLYLTVGDAGKITLTFSPADQVSAVTVTAKKRSTADLANVGSRTTLRPADIEAVVTVKRDLRDVARRDPLADLDFINRSTGPSGGLYVAGSTPRSNRITIDGVRSQDDFGLNTGGLSTNRGPVSLEAVEQVAVVATPFDVEEGDFTGGALNMILKSGTNDFHGTLFDFYRTPRLLGFKLPATANVQNSDGSITPGLYTQTKVHNYIHDQNYGAFFSGPIIQDKLFFAVSYEKFQSYDITTTAGPAGAGFGQAFNKIPGISTGTNASQADINTVLGNWSNYAASGSLPPGSVPLVQPIKDEKSSVKIDWNITDTQRLSASYRHAYSSVEKRSTSTTGISLNTNWYAQPENEDTYALQLDSKWSPLLSTEARVSFRDYQRGQLPPEGQNFANFAVCTDATSVGTTTSCTSGVPSISFGPDQFRQANQLKTTDTAADLSATYRLFDTHQIKAGYEFKGVHIYDLFVQNAIGSYYFDSVSDFAKGLANSYSYGNSPDGNPGDAAEKFSYRVQTLYAQDTWDILSNLTVNYGVRYDFYADDVKPTLNTNFVTRYGYSNQTTYDGINVLMPRLSAKWRTNWFELSGGIGLVSGGLPDVFIGNSYGAQTGALYNNITIKRNADGSFTNSTTGAPVDAVTGASILGSLASPLTKNAALASAPATIAQSLITQPGSTQRLAYTNSIAPGFDMPSDWKANVSFKTSRWHWDFGVDAVAVMSNTNIAFRDLRARPLTINGVQQYTPDGRLRYDGLQIAGATPALVNQNRAALGLDVDPNNNPDLANVGSNGDIQAFNPKEQNWFSTIAFSASTSWKGFDIFAAYTIQNGVNYGGIGEFATTEGGNSSSGNLYADQVSKYDPNTSVKGRDGNEIKQAIKLNVSYKREFVKGLETRFTLFGESRSGRRVNFLMSDPALSSGRGQVFGVYADDQLLYVPNLGAPSATNPLQFTSPNGTTVFFKTSQDLAAFKSLVSQFGLPQGGIVPKGFGQNPHVDRFDFQFSQELPGPVEGHKVIFTVDIANLGNLLNKKWGVVKEYSNSRAGQALVNVTCADANGVAPTAANPATCASYVYGYSSVGGSNNPLTDSKPFTIDPASSLWQIELGLKYKF